MTKESGESTLITTVGKVDKVGEKNAYILFLSGPLVGKLHPLDEGETILGRADEATIKVNDNRISRQHVSIQVGEEGTTLTDLGSTNGTYVNGKQIQTHTLRDGDRVQLSSNTIFKFAYQDNLENVFHKELYKMAVIDALTGVFNKRYFMDRLKEEFSHAKRIRHALSLLMCDLDHFKKINDVHGHLAGDCALAHVAKIIRPMIRGGDVFARYGGEEFAILLRNTNATGGLRMAERIRQMIEKNPARFKDALIPLSVSLGVTTLDAGEEYDTPKSFLETADKLLYRSKAKGRNCVTTRGAK